MIGPWDALAMYLRGVEGIGEAVNDRIWFSKAPQNAGKDPYFVVTGHFRYDNGHHTRGAMDLKIGWLRIIGVAQDTAGAVVIRSTCQAIVNHLVTVIGQPIGDYHIAGFWVCDELMEGWTDSPDSDEQGLHTEVLPYKVGFYYTPTA